MVLTAALFCMAINIYHESRGEPLSGQQAVALVTWNRAEHDRDRVCDVVTKHRQFSWTVGNLERRSGVYHLKKKMNPKDDVAWKSALFTAKLVLSNRLHDFTNGSTHYHANYVAPRWHYGATKTMVLGKHIFYKMV